MGAPDAVSHVNILQIALQVRVARHAPEDVRVAQQAVTEAVEEAALEVAVEVVPADAADALGDAISDASALAREAVLIHVLALVPADAFPDAWVRAQEVVPEAVLVAVLVRVMGALVAENNALEVVAQAVLVAVTGHVREVAPADVMAVVKDVQIAAAPVKVAARERAKDVQTVLELVKAHALTHVADHALASASDALHRAALVVVLDVILLVPVHAQAARVDAQDALSAPVAQNHVAADAEGNAIVHALMDASDVQAVAAGIVQVAQAVQVRAPELVVMVAPLLAEDALAALVAARVAWANA